MIQNSHTLTKEELKEINIPLGITDNDQTNKFLYLPNEDNSDIRTFEKTTHYTNDFIVLSLSTPFGR